MCFMEYFHILVQNQGETDTLGNNHWDITIISVWHYNLVHDLDGLA